MQCACAILSSVACLPLQYCFHILINGTIFEKINTECKTGGAFSSYQLNAHFLYSITIYRVIHKSLRDFRPLRYSSRDGHAEGEHVNRKRATPSFGPTLQVLDMLTSEGSWQTFLAHARQSRPMAPAGLFVSQRTGIHSAGISCTTHELFCP